MTAERYLRFWKDTSIVLIGMILAAMIALVVATRGSAGQPPPGLMAGVSAVDTLPAEQIIPDDVRATLGVLDPSLVGPVDQTARRLRKLQSNLGKNRVAIYAFRSRTRSVCMIVQEYAAICPSSLDSGRSGLLISVGGGYGTVDSPGALAGIAADNVNGIDLSVDGKSVPVLLRNNAVFAELPSNPGAIEIVAHYDGFEDQTFTLNLGD